MAVAVCSTSEPPPPPPPPSSISPRLSFSQDLHHPSSEITSDSTRSDQFLLSPTFNFHFCTTTTLTPADELFSNGKILPTQIKKPQPHQHTHQKPLKDFVFHPKDHDQEQEKATPRSFWQFRRSTSLNCDSGKGSPRGLLRSLSLKSLSRSNSTGSAKRNEGRKVVEKSKVEAVSSLRRCSSSTQPPSSSTHVYYTYQNSNNSKSCKGGIRIIPILNIPPAYNISKGTINFFGFGSFCNGKAKKKSK